MKLMLYSKRRNLSLIFDKYCKDNHALNCSESVVTWLYANGLLDVDKALKFLDENKDEKNN